MCSASCVKCRIGKSFYYCQFEKTLLISGHTYRKLQHEFCKLKNLFNNCLCLIFSITFSQIPSLHSCFRTKQNTQVSCNHTLWNQLLLWCRNVNKRNLEITRHHKLKMIQEFNMLPNKQVLSKNELTKV